MNITAPIHWHHPNFKRGFRREGESMTRSGILARPFTMNSAIWPRRKSIASGRQELARDNGAAV